MMELTAERLKPDALHIGTLDLEPLTLPYRKLYRAEYAEQARKLCLLGVDDTGLADFFETDMDTLRTWKRLHGALVGAIQQGRLLADVNVGHALYRRAVGYDVPKVHVSSYRGKVTRTETTRHIPPSVKASIFWLSSRMPKQWGRSDTDVSVCI